MSLEGQALEGVWVDGAGKCLLVDAFNDANQVTIKGASSLYMRDMSTAKALRRSSEWTRAQNKLIPRARQLCVSGSREVLAAPGAIYLPGSRLVPRAKHQKLLVQVTTCCDRPGLQAGFEKFQLLALCWS